MPACACQGFTGRQGFRKGYASGHKTRSHNPLPVKSHAYLGQPGCARIRAIAHVAVLQVGAVGRSGSVNPVVGIVIPVGRTRSVFLIEQIAYIQEDRGLNPGRHSKGPFQCQICSRVHSQFAVGPHATFWRAVENNPPVSTRVTRLMRILRNTLLTMAPPRS